MNLCMELTVHYHAAATQFFAPLTINMLLFIRGVLLQRSGVSVSLLAVCPQTSLPFCFAVCRQ